MKRLRFVFRYVQYLLRAGNRHGLHSPFVYELYENVICNRSRFYNYHIAETLRAKMLADPTEITLTDLGAGSMLLKGDKRKISSIASSAVKPAKYGQLLFRLVNHFQPSYILELGTCLGVTTVYLATAAKKSKVVSIEGCPEVSILAHKNFAAAKAGNIEHVIGEFGKMLPSVVGNLPQLDFVYFDGNHRREPTLEYFRLCLEKANENSVFVIDDIHWSAGMEDAWKEIKQHPRVTVTIDLFHMGLVFFRNTQAKEHFILRY